MRTEPPADLDPLAGRRILVAISGSIAAYKSATLVRLLVKAGADVKVVMTPAAAEFITPLTLQALSGKPVYTDMWDALVPDSMAHIALSRGSDAIVVAPATADFIAKLAHGLADDLLSTLCLATDAPILVAPAMNREMWDNAATQRNVEQLRRDGIVIVGPASGEQACGETGAGRMLEPADMHRELAALFAPGVLAGACTSQLGSSRTRLTRRALRSVSAAIASPNAPTPGSTILSAAANRAGSLVISASKPTFSNPFCTLRRFPIW